MQSTDALAAICALISFGMFLSGSGSFRFGRRRSGVVRLLLGAALLVLGVGFASGVLPVSAGN